MIITSIIKLVRRSQFMPKKHYLYANKKVLKEGRNQQEEDFNYFYSPKYAKQIGIKYGESGKAIEVAFKQYFEAMKHLGLTKLIDKDNLRKKIDKFMFYYNNSFGENGSGALAMTDLVELCIEIRKSIKVGDYETLFHEFNHLISAHESNGDNWRYQRDEEIFSTGYDIKNVTEGIEYNTLFNEGVTDLLALLQYSYLKKTVALNSSGYELEVGFLHSLYMVCGNALFEGYFGGGKFGPIARAIGEPQETDALAVECVSNIQTDEISLAILSDRISNLAYSEPLEAIAEFNDIQYDLINILYKKVFLDITNNLDKFNDFSEIEATVFTAFANYAKTLYFGSDKYSIYNPTRNDVFEYLTETYFGTLNNIGFIIQEIEDVQISYQEPRNSFETIFENFVNINDCSYGLIDYRQKPIDVISKNYVISVFEPNKANYLRKKNGYDNVSEMKNEFLHKKIVESLENDAKSAPFRASTQDQNFGENYDYSF